MKNQVIDADDLVKSAVDVENAMKGLAQFVFDNVSEINAKRDSLSALSGLVEAVSCLAERHSELCSKFSE